jgi:hypothetical protein
MLPSNRVAVISWLFFCIAPITLTRPRACQSCVPYSALPVVSNHAFLAYHEQSHFRQFITSWLCIACQANEKVHHDGG